MFARFTWCEATNGTNYNEQRQNIELFYSFRWERILHEVPESVSSWIFPPSVLSLGPPCGLMNHSCSLPSMSIDMWAFTCSKPTHSLETSTSKLIFSSSHPRGSGYALSSQPRPILYASAFWESLASYLDSLSSVLLEANWMLLPEVYKEDMRRDKPPLHSDWCK